MFAYLLEGIYGWYAFLKLYWNWTSKEKFQFYVHYRVLSEGRLGGTFDRLDEHFFAIIFHLIFKTNPVGMTDQVKESLKDIVDWFATPEGAYIRCFICQTIPHLMPQYVTNKVVMQEVENQLDKGLPGTLHRRKETPWPNDIPIKDHIIWIK